MSVTTKITTLEQLIAIPTDEPWEVWEGDLQEVPGVGGTVSELASQILVLLWGFVRPRNLGMITMADGAYILSHVPLTVVMPDVGFVSWTSLPGGSRPEGYIPVRPDLAVEVRSPTDRPGLIAEKMQRYALAGVPLVWWVDPRRQIVSIYRHGIFIQDVGIDAVLDGENVLPGFRLPVADIFR